MTALALDNYFRARLTIPNSPSYAILCGNMPYRLEAAASRSGETLDSYHPSMQFVAELRIVDLRFDFCTLT